MDYMKVIFFLDCYILNALLNISVMTRFSPCFVLPITALTNILSLSPAVQIATVRSLAGQEMCRRTVPRRFWNRGEGSSTDGETFDRHESMTRFGAQYILNTTAKYQLCCAAMMPSVFHLSGKETCWRDPKVSLLW